MVRSFIALLCFTVMFGVIAFGLVVTPVLAFSTTGYSRVASQAAQSALIVAQRSATLSAVAPLVSGTSAGSVAVRIVASSVGWPAVGVLGGLTLLSLYYNSSKVAAIKAAAAPVGGFDIPGYTEPSGTVGATCPGGNYCAAGSDQVITKGTAVNGAYPWGTLPAGWANLGVVAATATTWTWAARHDANVPSTAGTFTTAGPATQAQIQTYIGGLPANDPNSIESNTFPSGTASSPIAADSVASNPVDATSLTTTVIPASTVSGSDLVVNPNAVPPEGSTTTKTGSQETTETTTTTTTTTTNPDGSVTTVADKAQQDDASVSCSTGIHDQRTFATILQDHIARWQQVGILGTLNNLKNIVWPSALPTYTFGPTLFGTFTLNFNTWAWVFSDVRLMTIAIASIYGVAIVFRGRASS